MPSFSYIHNNRYELRFAEYIAKVLRLDTELAAITLYSAAEPEAPIDLPAGFEVRNNVTAALAAQLGQQYIIQWQHSYNFIFQEQIVCRCNNQKQQSAFLGAYPGATHTTVQLP